MVSDTFLLLASCSCVYDELVCFRDIIRGNPNIKWESIKGLENAKKLLKEAVVMPIKYPTYVLHCYLKLYMPILVTSSFIFGA